MKRPNFRMMLGAIRLGWRSIKLLITDNGKRKSRWIQVKICIRVFFKGLVGIEVVDSEANKEKLKRIKQEVKELMKE